MHGGRYEWDRSKAITFASDKDGFHCINAGAFLLSHSLRASCDSNAATSMLSMDGPVSAQEHALGTFFCDPYASWQKGGVEHANGRIRRFLPKNTRLDQISHAEIDRIQRLFNNMPMKCLGYKTPTEVFLNEINTRCTSK